MSTQTVRTTIALPEDLLQAVDKAIAAGMARSRNDLLAMALRQLLAAHARAAVDAAFVGMGGDPDYAAESSVLEAGFDTASWDAFRQAEAHGG